MMQLIDFEGKLNQANNFFIDQGITQDDKLCVISIVGAQNSGKSTLLNALFDTQFKIYNPWEDFNKSDKGIKMGLVQHPNNNTKLVILDLEGTGFMDPAQKGRSIEHKLGLFNMLISDCLLINISINNIAHHELSCHPTLKIMMFFKYHYFNTCSPTKIIFIVRGGNGSSHPSQEQLLGYVNTKYIEPIWNDFSLRTPQDKIENFFDVSLFLLNYYDFKREDLNLNILNLKKHICSNLPPLYLHQISGNNIFTHFKSYWDAIAKGSDSKIENMAESIIHNKCFGSLMRVLKNIQAETISYMNISDYVPPSQFVEWCKKIHNNFLDEYEEGTAMYKGKQVHSFKQLCMDTLYRSIMNVAKIQNIKVEDKYLNVFKEYVDLAFHEILSQISTSNVQTLKIKLESMCKEEKSTVLQNFYKEMEQRKVVIQDKHAYEYEFSYTNNTISLISKLESTTELIENKFFFEIERIEKKEDPSSTKMQEIKASLDKKIQLLEEETLKTQKSVRKFEEDIFRMQEKLTNPLVNEKQPCSIC